jgi:hypothetical protein
MRVATSQPYAIVAALHFSSACPLDDLLSLFFCTAAVAVAVSAAVQGGQEFLKRMVLRG